MEPLNNGDEEKEDKIHPGAVLLFICFIVLLTMFCYFSIGKVLIGKAVILIFFFSFLGQVAWHLIDESLKLSVAAKKYKGIFRFFSSVVSTIICTMLLWYLCFSLNIENLGEPYLARAKVLTECSVNEDSTFSYSTKLNFRKGFVILRGYDDYSELKDVDYVTAWLRDGKFWLTFYCGIYSIGTSIKGRVCSNYKNYKYPLVRVSVTECDSSGRVVNAIATDAEGNFSMDVKNTNNYLVISKAGYKTMKLKIGSYRNFNIELSMTP